MERNFRRQDRVKPKGGNSNLKGIVQGAAAVPRRAFGGAVGDPVLAMDATLYQHLPLPRAVGPYIPIRLTKRFKTTSHALIFGVNHFHATTTAGATDESWTNIICRSAVNSAAAISNIGNTQNYLLDTAGTSNTTQWVPAAFTLQVVNSQALQTTHGVVYIGRSSTALQLGGVSTTWNAAMDNLVQYQAPRMCMAAKLAMRGVKVSAIPLDMSKLASFLHLRGGDDAAPVTWSGVTTDVDTASEPRGLGPIYVYNPDGIELEYLVTVEWRVRFSYAEPASATHRHFPVASDNVWNKVIATMSAAGHGVADIAESVARIGAAARTFMSSSPGQAMLADGALMVD
jgi:hypothetical protein